MRLYYYTAVWMKNWKFLIIFSPKKLKFRDKASDELLDDDFTFPVKRSSWRNHRFLKIFNSDFWLNPMIIISLKSPNEPLDDDFAFPVKLSLRRWHCETSCFCNNFRGDWEKVVFARGIVGRKKATLNINKIRIPLLFSNEATNCASMREYWFKQTMVATIHSFKKLLTPILHILVFRKKGQSGFQYR